MGRLRTHVLLGLGHGARAKLKLRIRIGTSVHFCFRTAKKTQTSRSSDSIAGGSAGLASSGSSPQSSKSVLREKRRHGSTAGNSRYSYLMDLSFKVHI